MSFGWSAGDIAATIALAYNLIQVLDSCDGAAHEYREAVSFLRDLRRTLEPLAQFPNLTAQPGYGKEIAEQVGYIREPVETFLKSAEQYTASLGSKCCARPPPTYLSEDKMACFHFEESGRFENEDRVAYAD